LGVKRKQVLDGAQRVQLQVREEFGQRALGLGLAQQLVGPRRLVRAGVTRHDDLFGGVALHGSSPGDLLLDGSVGAARFIALTAAFQMLPPRR